MRLYALFILALALNPVKAFGAHAVSGVTAAITQFKAGRYTVSVKLENALFAKAGVEGTLIIPPGVSAAAPVVVGNTLVVVTRNGGVFGFIAE